MRIGGFPIYVAMTKWGPELRVEGPAGGGLPRPAQGYCEHLLQLIHIRDVCGAGEPHPKGDACVAPTM